ncbi:hypothetical protein D3C87_2045200 [compost metagenome]
MNTLALAPSSKLSLSSGSSVWPARLPVPVEPLLFWSPPAMPGGVEAVPYETYRLESSVGL